MEHDEFGSDVAGIIVAENGQLQWRTYGMGLMQEHWKLYQNICRKMEQHFMT